MGNKKYGDERLTEATQQFGINDVVTAGSYHGQALPSCEVFKKHMKSLKIRKENTIICYDPNGCVSVARTVWMLRYFGATNVRIMNGGLKKWK